MIMKTMYVKPDLKVMRMSLSNEILALSSMSEEGAKDVLAPHSIF